MLGKTLAGRYTIVKTLGSGGFGQTYLAEDQQLPGHPLCVVKHLLPQSKDPTTLQISRRLFDTEAQVLYRLGDHEQIPRLLAHFEENQEFYLVQQYIEGTPLNEKLIPDQPWTQEQVITLLQEILTPLVFVHEQKVIHRDIKPANLICRQKDNKIVLIDFGAVKQVRTQTVLVENQASITIAIGTPGYMPNEQFAGTPRPASDIYAVGIVAIQALTGLSPRQLQQDPNTGEIIWENQVQVHPYFAQYLNKMICYDFRQRYASASEALEALDALIQSFSATQTVPHQEPPTQSNHPQPSSIFSAAVSRRNSNTPPANPLPATQIAPPPSVPPQYRRETAVQFPKPQISFNVGVTKQQNSSGRDIKEFSLSGIKLIIMFGVSFVAFMGVMMGALLIAAAFMPDTSQTSSMGTRIAMIIFGFTTGGLLVTGSIVGWLQVKKWLG